MAKDSHTIEKLVAFKHARPFNKIGNFSEIAAENSSIAPICIDSFTKKRTDYYFTIVAELMSACDVKDFRVLCAEIIRQKLDEEAMQQQRYAEGTECRAQCQKASEGEIKEISDQVCMITNYDGP